MKNARNWIIACGCGLFLVFGVEAAVTGKDVPQGMKEMIVLVLGTGLGLEPLAAAAQKISGKKKDGEE